MSFPADYKQLLSRTSTIPAGETAVLVSPSFPSSKQYRLSITETGGAAPCRISVDLLHAVNEQQIQFSVGPNGAGAIELSGPCVVSGLAQGGAVTLTVNIVESMPSVEIVNFREGTNVLGAAYADIGSNGGFPQPFYNYAALYLTGAADVRLVNAGGVVIWEQLGANPQQLLLNQFFIGANLRLQARGAGVSAVVCWYNRR